MTEFTLLPALIGGLLIGLAAVALMALTGRIAGVSGFASRLLPPYTDDHLAMRVAFVGGLIVAPWLYAMAQSGGPDITITSNTGLLVVAGLLVGFGSVWGSGCTSGHGVCGLARLSQRSMFATASFMLAAGVTVFIVRHVLGG